MTTQGPSGGADPDAKNEQATIREPVRVLVCVGPRCDAEGRGRTLLREVEKTLRTSFPEALDEKRLKLTTRECLRLCTRDPVVRLEPSGDAFSNPDIDMLMREIAAALA
jgi:NADH:ubiquinone oxidoreductase subunit E